VKLRSWSIRSTRRGVANSRAMTFRAAPRLKVGTLRNGVWGTSTMRPALRLDPRQIKEQWTPTWADMPAHERRKTANLQSSLNRSGYRPAQMQTAFRPWRVLHHDKGQDPFVGPRPVSPPRHPYPRGVLARFRVRLNDPSPNVAAIIAGRKPLLRHHAAGNSGSPRDKRRKARRRKELSEGRAAAFRRHAERGDPLPTHFSTRG